MPAGQLFLDESLLKQANTAWETGLEAVLQSRDWDNSQVSIRVVSQTSFSGVSLLPGPSNVVPFRAPVVDILFKKAIQTQS